MLFDFHRRQTQKKRGSVHATYLIDGLAALEPPAVNGHKADDEDTPMQSSPFTGSSAPRASAEQEIQYRHFVTLTKEEHLEGTSDEFFLIWY